MITWLFTQVWLWSLASFALGALMTWLLFVRPARHRLKHALAEQVYYEQAYYDEPVYDDRFEPDHVEHDFDDRRDRDLEEPEGPLDLLAEQPPAAPRAYVPAPEPVREAEPEPIAGNEPTLAEFERSPQRPWVPAEAPPQPEVPAEQPAPTGNTWFRRWEEEQVAEEPEPDPAVTAVQPRVADAEPDTARETPVDEPTEQQPEERGDDLSGQLRSLFAPVEGGNPAGETGYIPPVGADATSVLPKIPREEPEHGASQVSGDLNLPGQAEELPRRTPSAESGAPQVEPRIPEALRQRAEAPKRRSEEPGTGGPANIQPAENLDEQADLPRRTPGAHPHPGREVVGNGPMIKGHSASRQYHSPDSPQYDEIVADVWFRTPADAETAGFAPWHGGRR
ncbi:hypothetical protein [Saccharopolyspora griseoalba]|uniref:Uncharacterized protein n=1 Tax=Saccharopolyspora griseoalba TaxID=1431848 RepID=A0ABW2LKC9_9PSEU